jgi:hypothetical protein
MSTIRHPIHHHARSYAVTALVLGLLAVLVVAVLPAYLGSDGTSPAAHVNTTAIRHFPGPTFRAVCFARRPGQPIELARTGCTTP